MGCCKLWKRDRGADVDQGESRNNAEKVQKRQPILERISSIITGSLESFFYR